MLVQITLKRQKGEEKYKHWGKGGERMRKEGKPKILSIIKVKTGPSCHVQPILCNNKGNRRSFSRRALSVVGLKKRL